jgi:hypothetical protein
MSKISKENREKIKTNVLRILYDEAPVPLSATNIALTEARDKQFILTLLKELEKGKIVKNTTKKFSRKSFWMMTDQAYKKYKELL